MARTPREASHPLPPRLALDPAYPDVRSEIVRPDLVQVTTRYFWARWAPRLGPRATALLLALRRRCYANTETGESRDWCAPTQEDLALELGCHRQTVLAALGRLEHAGLIRRTASYERNWARGSFGVSRRADRISVLLAEPLVPEDEGRAAGLQAERLVNGGAQCGQPVDNSATRCERDGYPVDNYSVPRAQSGVTRSIADVSNSSTHNAVEQSDSNTVNGRTRQRTLPPFRSPIGSNGDRRPHRSEGEAQGPRHLPPGRLDPIVIELEQRLSDPGSRGFFVRLAQRLPHDAIRLALADALTAVTDGRARSSAAAYFTGIVKRRALELGVSLTGGRT